MRHPARAAFVRAAVIAATLISTAFSLAQAQGEPPAAPVLSRDEIAALAKIQVAIGLARDSSQAQYAKVGNKKVEIQQQLQDKLHTQIEEILHHNGMTEQDFERKTYLVSSDLAARKTFDSVLVAITGQPTPGQVLPTAGRAPPVKVPDGPVGVHIGHVVNGFGDTPNAGGLLPTALGEARIAAQHAALGMRNPTNLESMKLHAGHVIHALDPTVVTTGPGQGYGLKKAAAGVASHIELAAKAVGASPNVVTHSEHIASASKSASSRADQIIALAKQVQAATAAPEAAALMSQISSLADQLIAGVDANGDGRIGWQEGEGGLQQAQEHVNLMLAGEKLP